jgi:hypothetical protein
MSHSPSSASANANTSFGAFGPGFSAMLASMQYLSDQSHAACPQEWRDLAGLIHTLIEDEKMTTEMAAWEAAVPPSFCGRLSSPRRDLRARQ